MKKLLILLIAASCAMPKKDVPVVKIAGKLRGIMMENKTQATIALDSLSGENNLYALGAMENIDGEILIWNSQPMITQVINDSVKTKYKLTGGAALLVYTNVLEWKEFSIGQNMSIKNLEEELSRLSMAEGLVQPFPFLIKTSRASVKSHVIAGSHETHDSGYKINLTDQPLEVLGFYSDHHQGIFTHHSSNLHMHAKDLASTFNAHVDELELNGKSVILLPKQL